MIYVTSFYDSSHVVFADEPDILEIADQIYAELAGLA